MLTTNKNDNLNLSNIDDAVFVKLLVLFSLGVALFIYGYEITNFSLSADEEFYAFGSEGWLLWISQGRWAMGVLTYLLPEMSRLPFLPTLLFAVGLGLSAVIFSMVFTRRRESAIVFIGIFVTSPIWLHIGEFNTLSWGFSLGLLATSFAAKFINAGGTKNAIIAGICISFALAVYQALFIMYLVVVLLIGIKKEWGMAANQNSNFFDRNKSLFSDIVISLTIAVVVYFLLHQFFIYLSDSNLTYLNRYVNLTEYTDERSKAAVIRVINEAKGFLLGTDPTFLGVGTASLLLVWLGALVVLKKQFNRNVAIVTKIYVLLLSIGVLLLTILLIIISAGYIPTRALISFPLLYAVLAAMAFQYKKGQRILWIIFFIALFINSYIANSLFYADHLARQRDLVMATRMIDRIEEVGRDAFGETIPIAIIGQWQHELGGPAHRVELFGGSFFELNGGNIHRIAAYLRYLGSQRLFKVRITKVRDELDQIKLHPSWPAKESVFLTEHAVIIKLDDELSYQQGLELNK